MTRRRWVPLGLLTIIAVAGCSGVVSPEPDSPAAATPTAPVWICSPSSATRVLPLSRDAQPVAIAADPTGIWVAEQSSPKGKLIHFDMDGHPDRQLSSSGWSPAGLSVGDGRIWVSDTIGDGSRPATDPTQNSIEDVDEANGTLLQLIRVANPSAIFGTSSTAWVATGSALVEVGPGANMTTVADLSPRHITWVRGSATRLAITASDPISSAGRFLVLDQQTGNAESAYESPYAIGPAMLDAADVFFAGRTAARGWELEEATAAGPRSIGSLPDDTDINSFASDGSGAGWAVTTAGCLYQVNLSDGQVAPRAVDVQPGYSDVVGTAVGNSVAWVLTSDALIRVPLP